MKKILIWLGVLAVFGLIIFGLVKLNGDGKNSGPSLTISTEVLASDHVKGIPDAKVTLVEYADFQCPACGYFEPILKQAVSEFGDQLRFVYRHFPLIQIHKNASLAAQASEAAEKQGKFWEMHDLLYKNQTNWSISTNVEEVFVDYAKTLGLDSVKFLADLNSKEVKDEVSAAYDEATRLGLPGTPTIFINGKKINSPSSYDELKSIINAAINNQ